MPRPSPAPGEDAGEVSAAARGRGYRELQRRHLLRLSLTYLAPLIVLTVFFLLQYRLLLDESRRLHLKSIAETQANTLDLFLRERVVNVSNLIRDPQLSLPPGAEPMRRCLERLKRDSDSFVDVGFFDSAGVQVAYAGPYPALERRDYSQESWYTALKSGPEGFIITDIYLGFRGQPHFTIAVSRTVGQEYYVFRATLDPQEIYEYVTTLKGSEEVATCIVNQEGRYQLAPPRVGKVLESSAIVPPSTPSMGTQSGRMNGRSVPYAYSWLRTANWALIVQPSSASAAGLFSSGFTGILIISVIVALTVSGIIWVRAKKLVRLQEESDQTKAQLEHAAKLASVGELAAGIAHEINNPLAIITEEAGLLKDLIGPEFGEQITLDQAVPYLDRIERAAFRCRDITGKLLNFVRKTEVHLQEHDIHRLVDEVIDGLLGHEMAVSNIQVVKQYAEDLSTLVTDRNKLQQVLLNLLNNAVDALQGPGRITIATERKDGRLHLSVSDNGKGMTPSQLENIFLPFYTTKEVGKGTGLGLSVSYGIVRSLGGRMLVDSTPGKGSTFTIVLPMQPAHV